MSQPTKRARAAVSEPSRKTVAQATKTSQPIKRPANTQAVAQNAAAQKPVKLSVNSNLQQQQFDAIVGLKNKAIANAALFPLHAQELLGHCSVDNITTSPHQLSTALQALSTVFTHHITSGSLYPTTSSIPKDLDKKTTEIEVKKTKQLHSYFDLIASLLRQDPAANATLHKTCWKVSLDFITTVGNRDISMVSSDNGSNLLWTLLFSYFGSNLLPGFTIDDFFYTRLVQYDDLRFYTYQAINTILPLTSTNTSSLSTATAAHWTASVPGCSGPVFRSNILALLSLSKFSLVTGKRWFKSSHISSSMSDFSAKQRALLSTCWFTFLKAVKTGDRQHTIGYKPANPTKQALAVIYDDVSIYTRIFAVMDTLILPNITQPLLLADFLSASFSFGGLVAVQSLNGLFHLMQKHKLEYPNFFTQLYNICTLDILYSPYAITFFTLLNLVLQGNYLPLYLVIGFMKKLSRLSLFGPSTCTIYTTALIFNIYRKHPMTAYLVNRKASIIQGIAKNAQMAGDLALANTMGGNDISPEMANAIAPTPVAQSIQSKTAPVPVVPDVVTDEAKEKQDEPQVNLFSLLKTSTKPKKVSKTSQFLNTLSLTTTPAVLSAKATPKVGAKSQVSEQPQVDVVQQPNDVSAQHVQAKWLNGQDPFLIDIFALKPINPELSNGRTSSLIETKDMINHFHQQVRTSAKLLFDDNAPKHPQDITHLILYLSYHAVIQQALTYRSKHLIPTAFQKPLGLLGKSERIIDPNEKYDADAKRRGEELDKQRNTLESIFMW